MYDLTDENIKNAALGTVSDIWACIDWDKVDSRRAYNIYDEYASKIKSCSMTTNNYGKFVEKLCKKMDVRSLRYNTIKDISAQSDEFKKEVLKMLREETLLIVLELRSDNDRRRKMRKMLKDKEEAERKLEEEGRKQVILKKKGDNINE